MFLQNYHCKTTGNLPKSQKAAKPQTNVQLLSFRKQIPSRKLYHELGRVREQYNRTYKMHLILVKYYSLYSHLINVNNGKIQNYVNFVYLLLTNSFYNYGTRSSIVFTYYKWPRIFFNQKYFSFPQPSAQYWSR